MRTNKCTSCFTSSRSATIIGIHSLFATLDIRMAITVIHHQISPWNNICPKRWMLYMSTFCTNKIVKVLISRKYYCHASHIVESITDTNRCNGIIILQQNTPVVQLVRDPRITIARVGHIIGLGSTSRNPARRVTLPEQLRKLAVFQP